MRDYSSSIDREQLRRIKYGTTPEQRMNWLVDAGKFANEAAKNRNKKWLPRPQ
ncbi:hypothetical protein HY285_05265 [Candidatus Peregrinibacteria bacterium]|nr:hypothetical protein [Candidatus Peregrinibacteria bacterium]MBI3816921.1 hypothetical protein [Candidatus Peregrinibacteria bacterium]